MRHMYDSDGMIPYAGTVRASRRWKSSRSRRTGTPYKSHNDPIKVAERELDIRTHKERIAEILASSKWHHNYNEM